MARLERMDDLRSTVGRGSVGEPRDVVLSAVLRPVDMDAKVPARLALIRGRHGRLLRILSDPFAVAGAKLRSLRTFRFYSRRFRTPVPLMQEQNGLLHYTR